MRKYKAYSGEEVIALAQKADISVDEISRVNLRNSSDIFNLLYNFPEEFKLAGMSPEDYFYSQLYWSCRYLYEVEAIGDIAPDFEASIIDIVNYFIIVLSDLYGEDIDQNQIMNIDFELEKEFGLKRKGSFI